MNKGIVGGAWRFGLRLTRLAFTPAGLTPGYRYYDLGFRLVRKV